MQHSTDNVITCSFIEQIIETDVYESGAYRFQKKLSQALALQPDLLLLNEPTNHLDSQARASLIRMLQQYKGTFIIASHDEELLRAGATSLWHIDHGKVVPFSGSYKENGRKW